MAAAAHFVEQWLDQRSDDHLLIVDHGSYDVNGSYRSLFDRPSWRYVGVDLEPGPNVDLVLPAPYAPLPFADSSVDVVVSGQVLEHTAFPWVLVGTSPRSSAGLRGLRPPHYARHSATSADRRPERERREFD